MIQQQEGFYINTKHGLALFKFNDAFCHTVYEDKHCQIFYNETGNFVYKKEEERVYQLTIDNWTRLVLKIETIINFS